MPASLTFAIGDVHGCFEQLRTLLGVCEKVAGGRRARFVLIGDYVDRGPDSKKVLDFLIAQQRDGDRFICLLGNHEAMLLDAAHPDRTVSDVFNWRANGGETTLQSYGVDDETRLPAAHLAWIEALPLHFVDGSRLFVHAGVRPGIPLEDQTERDLLWIREPFLSSVDDHGRVRGAWPYAAANSAAGPAQKPPQSRYRRLFWRRTDGGAVCRRGSAAGSVSQQQRRGLGAGRVADAMRTTGRTKPYRAALVRTLAFLSRSADTDQHQRRPERRVGVARL